MDRIVASYLRHPAHTLNSTLLRLDRVEKRYSLTSSPRRKMLELLLGRTPEKTLQALEPICLEIRRGESLGLVGRNGAGKSTLLQILAGVVSPTSGTITGQGRVAALLELGTGLAPELTGRENIALSGPLMGLGTEELTRKTPEIIAFSELEAFMDQPVRTYSTGMVVRLAFSIATACNPDLLIVDEALSVGDGVFARKSFDRIMALKNNGTSIVFCSHVLYQVEKLCDAVIWLDKGQVKALGVPGDVLLAYEQFLDQTNAVGAAGGAAAQKVHGGSELQSAHESRVLGVQLTKNNALLTADTTPVLLNGHDSVGIRVQIQVGAASPAPHLAFVIHDHNRKVIASASTERDRVALTPNAAGMAECEIVFEALPLLRDTYRVDVMLLCDRGIRVIEAVYDAAHFTMTQDHPEIGVVSLARHWRTI